MSDPERAILRRLADGGDQEAGEALGSSDDQPSGTTHQEGTYRSDRLVRGVDHVASATRDLDETARSSAQVFDLQPSEFTAPGRDRRVPRRTTSPTKAK
jgi:hypothetical protein